MVRGLFGFRAAAITPRTRTALAARRVVVPSYHCLAAVFFQTRHHASARSAEVQRMLSLATSAAEAIQAQASFGGRLICRSC